MIFNILITKTLEKINKYNLNDLRSPDIHLYTPRWPHNYFSQNFEYRLFNNIEKKLSTNTIKI